MSSFLQFVKESLYSCSQATKAFALDALSKHLAKTQTRLFICHRFLFIQSVASDDIASMLYD